MTKITLWHEGDPTTGVDGERAVVEMTITSDTHAQFVLDQLETAFRYIWDYPVLSDIETEDEEDFDFDVVSSYVAPAIDEDELMALCFDDRDE